MRTAECTNVRPLKHAGLKLLVLLFTPLAITLNLQAAVVLINDRATFNAVTSNRVTVDFEGIVPAGSSTRYNSGVTLNGIQFIGTSAGGTQGELFIESAAVRNWGTGDKLVGDRFGFFQSSGIPTGNIQAILPADTFAVGTDFMLALSDNTKPSAAVLFSVFNGATQTDFTLNSAADAAAFAGFVSDAPITSIKYRTLGLGANSPYGALDNFTVGSVPEPRITGLLAIGIFALFHRRRRN